ncbi:hypothetical protein HY546_01490 [archaeon]|nr:hypothetical protein [archaeon]
MFKFKLTFDVPPEKIDRVLEELQRHADTSETEFVLRDAHGRQLVTIRRRRDKSRMIPLAPPQRELVVLKPPSRRDDLKKASSGTSPSNAFRLMRNQVSKTGTALINFHETIPFSIKDFFAEMRSARPSVHIPLPLRRAATSAATQFLGRGGVSPAFKISYCDEKLSFEIDAEQAFMMSLEGAKFARHDVRACKEGIAAAYNTTRFIFDPLFRKGYKPETHVKVYGYNHIGLRLPPRLPRGYLPPKKVSFYYTRPLSSKAITKFKKERPNSRAFEAKDREKMSRWRKRHHA